MGDVANSLRGLVLSASEIKSLTSWPDPMVEDYLNIFDNLVTLATEIETETSDSVKKADFTVDGGILVGTGAGAYQEETGATLRTSIGVDAAGTAACLVAGHVVAADPHTQYLLINGTRAMTGGLVILDAGTIGSVTTPGAVAIASNGDTQFIGNINISKADPEHRLTDTGDSEYTRLTRTDTSALAQRRNRAFKSGANGSLNFDGTGDYVDCGTDASLRITTTLTVAAWIKLNGDYSSIQVIVSNYGGANANYHIDFGRTNNEFIFLQGASIVSTSSVVLADDDWHHIAVVRTGSAGNWDISWYFDGAFDKTDNTAVNPGVSPGIFAIGRVGSVASQYFNGNIDEVAVWGKELSANDISDLYAAGVGLYIDPTSTFPTDGGSQGTNLVGLWHLDDGSGGTAADSSAESNTGTLQPGIGQPAWADGKVVGTGADTEVLIWSSQDGTGSIEEGIQTFGDSNGRTVIDGKSIRFNTAGMEVGKINASGNLVWVSDLTFSGANFGIVENEETTISYDFHINKVSVVTGAIEACVQNTATGSYSGLRLISGNNSGLITFDDAGGLITGGGLLIRNLQAKPIVFRIVATNVGAISAVGNFLLGTTTDPTSMTKGIVVAAGVLPTANPASGFTLGTVSEFPSFRTSGGTIIGLNQSLLTTDAHQVASLELGHASDTTLTRVSAGVVAVEGTNIMMVGAAPTAHEASHAVGGGDTVFPADPGADRYLMWDDDPGALVWDTGAGGIADPGASTDHALLRWNGATGDTVQDSTIIVSDAGEMTNASQPCFRVTMSAVMTNIAVTTNVTILFDTEQFDIGSNFNTGTYTFTAPVTGKYLFTLSATIDDWDVGATYYDLTIYTSNLSVNFYKKGDDYTADGDQAGIAGSVITDMDANDVAYGIIRQQGGAQQADVVQGTVSTVFSGALLC